MLYCYNPSLETCVGECNCSSTELNGGKLLTAGIHRIVLCFRVSFSGFYSLFLLFFCFFTFFNFWKTKQVDFRIWSLTHCMYCFLKFIYFNSNAQRFSPNLGRLVSPKLCEIALANKNKKRNHAYDICILIEMSAERKYLMHWLLGLVMQ